MAFSTTHAALEGFRVVGRRPVSILGWAIFWTLVTAALVLGACAMLGPTMVGEIMRHPHDTEWVGDYDFETVSDFWEAFSGVFQALGVVLLGLTLACIIQKCAVFRAVLRPEQRGLAYLRFGGDELRQIGLMIISFVFYGLISFGLTAAFYFGFHALDLDHAIRVLAHALWIIVCLALYLTLAVRLSLASAMTFAQKRIRFFGSWGLTKGHFWPLFGVYLLALVFFIVVLLVGDMLAEFVGGMLGFSGHAMMRGGAEHFDIANISYDQIPALLGAGGLAYLVIQMIASAIQFSVFWAPQAAAYRGLMEERNPPTPPEAAAAEPDGHGDHGAPAVQAAPDDSHGLEAATLAAAAAHAEDHSHGEVHTEPAPEAHPEAAFAAPAETHLEPHGEPHPEAYAEPHAEAPAEIHHAEPIDAHHAPPTEAHHEAPTEPAAADAHGDHGDHGTHPAEPHAEAHAEPHAEPLAEAHQAPEAHAEPAADHGHGESHGDSHGDAPAEIAADAGHTDPHAAPEAHVEPAAPEHPAEEAHPASPHDDPHGAPSADPHDDGHDDGHGGSGHH